MPKNYLNILGIRKRKKNFVIFILIIFYEKAGILTYASGENTETSIRQQNDLAPVFSSNVEKYRNYTSPGLGLIRVHYGQADDPKTYEKLTHGIKSANNSLVSNLILL